MPCNSCLAKVITNPLPHINQFVEGVHHHVTSTSYSGEGVTNHPISNPDFDEPVPLYRARTSGLSGLNVTLTDSVLSVAILVQ
jgi:hypothetical protein